MNSAQRVISRLQASAAQAPLETAILALAAAGMSDSPSSGAYPTDAVISYLVSAGVDAGAITLMKTFLATARQRFASGLWQ